MEQHSPLPWEIGVDQLILDAKTDLVADVIGADEPIRITNAQFIVTCVNSHADLLEACENLISSLTAFAGDMLNETRGSMGPAAKAAITAGRKAIAKATNQEKGERH